MSTQTSYEKALELMSAAIIAEVEDRLSFNVKAYGKAWTGEGEDTEFIVGDAAEKALAKADDLLREHYAEQLLGKEAVERAVLALPTIGADWWSELDESERENIRNEFRTQVRAASSTPEPKP